MSRIRFRSAPRRHSVPPDGVRGFTLTEILVALGLLMVLAGSALPFLAGHLRAERVRGAAMAMRSLLQRARAEAAARAANVAVVFDPPLAARGIETPGEGPGSDGTPVIALVLDTNHNGVRRSEIAAGGESLLGNPWRFGSRFPGVRWGAPAGTAGQAPLPGHAVGAAGMVSFSPLGASGSGRITVSGEGAVYAIVIHGGGSRIRMERRAGDGWVPM